ncbi:protein translocase subunit SecDF [Lactonifactor longoviformis]|uniref:Multifunctional fusion protein n=1 Tax=Lactonifactor longoviformis DSM 17459 TaxID=1122155 RepID=A0A1M4SBJ2_9CLOT|nr:protein translocase subunit SecDF [Lactonifactor longoviformis]POP31330.1 protein translocase subunit SecDF [Lactonifactor longoviformis]SHE29552.1 SecD/SecF fusion protein [Lactonifactor longoviformis DSM 17459]
MKKNKGIVVLILTVLITGFLVFTAAVGIGPTGTGAAKHIKTGLDLAGGVSITYETKAENPSASDMSDTIYKLQKRVEQYSTEAQVYQEGNNRISVEIPGATDANAILTELGKPGSLQFMDTEGNVVLEGSDVADAQGVVGEDNTTKNKQYVVSLTLTKKGAEKFAEATKANLNKQIAIVYDNETLSAPVVQSVISDGNAQITGMSSIEEAKNLAAAIRIGSLKLELQELRSNVVAAQLGTQAINTSVKAAGIGLALVILFMIIVYLIPGLVSGIALIIYVCLDLICLNAFDLTLTLPGIAGIILSIGMAVDANVIIYARIKEEIASGKSVRTSLQSGFKKAFSAIFDGNITTLIAAFVLNWLGSGSVKGFAQTLALGIVLSMFTALVVSRLIIYALYAVGVRDAKFYGKIKPREPINFLGKKKIFFAISIVLVLLAPVMMGVNQASSGKALNYSLEFVGGTSTNVTFNEDLSMEEIDSKVVPLVEDITGDANVQPTKVVNSNQVIIKTRTLSVDEREALNKAMVDNFQVDETKITTESISSTISGEMRKDAVIAVVVATLLMLVYIWFRFKDIRFASSAVLALIHDVLVVLAFYAIAKISISNTFIACMLTIVGYSINATIVIFDRIRENKGMMKKKDELATIVNASITQTLTRSIYTSLTTFIMVFLLFVMGVSSIREFALPLMVGILCGAYSSVCITGALWYVMKTKIGKNKA